MAVVDALCSDSCTHYLSDVPGAQEDTFFLTAMMDGLQY
jgi:hypothetical protein